MHTFQKKLQVYSPGLPGSLRKLERWLREFREASGQLSPPEGSDTENSALFKTPVFVVCNDFSVAAPGSIGQNGMAAVGSLENAYTPIMSRLSCVGTHSPLSECEGATETPRCSTSIDIPGSSAVEGTSSWTLDTLDHDDEQQHVSDTSVRSSNGAKGGNDGMQEEQRVVDTSVRSSNGVKGGNEGMQEEKHVSDTSIRISKCATEGHEGMQEEEHVSDTSIRMSKGATEGYEGMQEEEHVSDTSIRMSKGATEGHEGMQEAGRTSDIFDHLDEQQHTSETSIRTSKGATEGN